MKSHPSIAIVCVIAAGLMLGTTAAPAAPASASPSGLQQVQYPGNPDRRDFRDNRDRDRDQDFRGGRLFRAGERVPDVLLNRVVRDWEERGLSRPPGGHQWVRTAGQFLLVRFSDRRIARILTFE